MYMFVVLSQQVAAMVHAVATEKAEKDHSLANVRLDESSFRRMKECSNKREEWNE